MTILTFPAHLPARLQWTLESNTQVFESELNRSTQTADLPGARWAANLTFGSLAGRDARELIAFLTRLRGRAGRFYLPPLDHPLPDGTAAGTGRVIGANQTGNIVQTNGWTPNQPALLLPGDYIQLGNELKMVVATTASNAAGEAAITFEPAIRRSPAHNSVVVTENPVAIMAAQADNAANWQATPPVIYALTLSCAEPLDL